MQSIFALILVTSFGLYGAERNKDADLKHDAEKVEKVDEQAKKCKEVMDILTSYVDKKEEERLNSLSLQLLKYMNNPEGNAEKAAIALKAGNQAEAVRIAGSCCKFDGNADKISIEVHRGMAKLVTEARLKAESAKPELSKNEEFSKNAKAIIDNFNAVANLTEARLAFESKMKGNKMWALMKELEKLHQ